MKTLALWCAAALVLICLSGCAHGKKESPAPPAKLQGQSETFTGKVVLAPEGYRLKLTDSDEHVRLTRATERSELVKEEIKLRKYYEKTLAVRGKREGEWIWAASVVGQWLRPGEASGPNVTAPKVDH
jgi:hypothetical protein